MKHEHEGEVNHTVELPEEVIGTVARVKAHIKKHQTVYACGATAVICITGMRKFGRPMTITNMVAPNIAPVFNNDNSSVVNFGGYATKITQRLSDGKIWGKAGEAAYEIAEKHGIPFEYARQLLSKHTNGNLPDVFGEVYQTIGIGTTG